MDSSEENDADLQSQVWHVFLCHDDVMSWADVSLTQIEEIEALSSIYGDEWCVIDEASRVFCIRISDDTHQPKWTVCLQVYDS